MSLSNTMMLVRDWFRMTSSKGLKFDSYGIWEGDGGDAALKASSGYEALREQSKDSFRYWNAFTIYFRFHRDAPIQDTTIMRHTLLRGVGTAETKYHYRHPSDMPVRQHRV